MWGSIYNCMDMGYLKLNDRLDDIGFGDLRSICKFGVDYCGERLGINRRHKTGIRFSIRKGYGNKLLMGNYDPYNNIITIYWNRVSNVREFIHTFIHEYVHSLQPIRTKYFKLLDEVGYERHPHELECNRVADEMWYSFWEEYCRRCEK